MPRGRLPGLTPPVPVGLLAAVTGVSVAGIYYHQLLLAEIAGDLTVPHAQVMTIPVATQAGYRLGMLLLVLLGHRIDRRRLVGMLLYAGKGFEPVGRRTGCYAGGEAALIMRAPSRRPVSPRMEP